jgi:hypothetical protein
MTGRVALLVLLLTLAIGVSASEAATLTAHSFCGSRCGQVSAIHGSGVLTQHGSGLTLGTVGQGTIAIRDFSRNGKRDFSVGGWDRKWTTKDGYVHFAGKGMSYRAWTTWTVKITGGWGISTTTTAVGWGYIRGPSNHSAWLASRWTLRSGLGVSTWPHWPTAGKSFTISH